MFKKVLLLSSLLLSTQVFAYANLEVNVPNKNTFVHTDTEMSAGIEYGIQNNTHYAQTYTITYNICPAEKKCTSDSFKVNLQSQQREQKKIVVSRMLRYGQARVYDVRVAVSIRGESIADKAALGALNVYQK